MRLGIAQFYPLACDRPPHRSANLARGRGAAYQCRLSPGDGAPRAAKKIIEKMRKKTGAKAG